MLTVYPGQKSFNNIIYNLHSLVYLYSFKLLNLRLTHQFFKVFLIRFPQTLNIQHFYFYEVPLYLYKVFFRKKHNLIVPYSSNTSNTEINHIL